MKHGKPRGLAESRVLIVWPKASASIGIILASFVEQHRRTESASFAFITHPVGPSVLRETEFVFYKGQQVEGRSHLRRETKHIPLLSQVIDCLLTVFFIVLTRRRHQLYISAGVNLGLLGNLLKRFGVVEKTAYVVMDYWPQRYKSPFLTRMYRWIYSWCVTKADFVVDVAPTIDEARRRDGIKVDPQRRIFAPHPIDLPWGSLPPQDEPEPDALIWAGALTPECGFELVIDAVELVARQRPNVVVNVTSYEPFREDLQKTIRERGLERHFRLVGYIKKEAEFNKLVSRHRIGLAPYRPDELSVKNYAGVARPWTYMANGVPPIITRVPPDAVEIQEAGAGFVIDYDRTQLADAILALLTDDQLYSRCRKKSLELARSRAPGPVFRELLSKMGLPPDD